MRPLGQNFEDMVDDCFKMNQIAQSRRAERLKDGSVMFMNREFNFSLDKETRLPQAFQEASKI